MRCIQCAVYGIKGTLQPEKRGCRNWYQSDCLDNMYFLCVYFLEVYGTENCQYFLLYFLEKVGILSYRQVEFHDFMMLSAGWGDAL